MASAIPNIPQPFRGEAIYLPYAGRIWLPIRKNGHTAILEAIQTSRQPWIPIQDTPLAFSAPRIAMWRNPYKRMESAYHTLAPKLEFNEWVLTICAQPDAERDPHVMTQWLSTTLVYPEGPDQIFHWDFRGLAAALGLEAIPRLNASDKPRLHWLGPAERVFEEAYDRDFIPTEI